MTQPTLLRLSALLTILAAPLWVGCEEEESIEPAPEESAAEQGADPLAEEESEAEEPVGPAASIPDEAFASYEIDPVHASIVFAGKHFDVSYTYGMIPQVEGTYELKKEPGESSIEIEAAADSLFTANKKRDDDLKGPDFLNVKQYPKITFKSTEIKSTEEGYEVTGDLTLHGETKSVTVTMEYTGAGTVPMDKSYRTGFEGEFTVDRNDFGISAMPPAVSDEIELIVSIEGIKQ